MPFSEFGPFAAALETKENEIPGYLKLLNLIGEDLGSVLRIIQDAVQTPQWERFAVRLLQNPNWRPHLVGGVALLYAPSDEVAEALWQAFDGGSWVAPQLAVVAYYADKQFISRAKQRVEALCPVAEPKFSSDLERHAATGPAGTTGRRAKNLASLLAICERIPHLEAWVAEMHGRTDVREFLKYDASTDDSSGIASGWLERINQCFESEGLQLEPAFDLPQKH